MKKIYLFIAAGMFAVSCSDDNNSSTNSVNPDPSSLIGKWDLVSWKIGNLQQDINTCQEANNYYIFADESHVTESFGDMGGTDCLHEQYNHTYTVTGDELYYKEITSGVPYQAKFKILKATDTEFTIKQFWVSQETPSGGIEEKTIPEDERETSTYTKI